MADSTHETEMGIRLRPIERTILRLADDGLSEAEIAWRIRRSPGYVERTLALARLPRAIRPRRRKEPWHLRPIERVVLKARESDIGEAEMAARLRRSPGYVQRVGEYADYKLARASGE